MGQERILVVEDERRVADALCRVLSLPQGGGYQVAHCDSAEAALDTLQKTHVDLLITDLRMPGMSGLDLLERVRQISPATRSVLITAFGSSEVEYQARRLANVYLPKPFSWQVFVQAVQRALTAPPVSPPRLVALSEAGLRAMQQRMESLRADTGARCVLLPDWSGQLLVECGQRGDVDINALLALTGNSIAAATEVSRLLNEEESFDLHVHEGKRSEVYAAGVRDAVFLLLLFDRRGGGGRIGLVSLYMRRAIEDLRRLLAEALIEPGTALGLRNGLATAMRDALDEAFTIGAPDAPPADRPTDTTGSALPDEPALPLLSLEQARALGLVDLGGAASRQTDQV